MQLMLDSSKTRWASCSADSACSTCPWLPRPAEALAAPTPWLPLPAQAQAQPGPWVPQPAPQADLASKCVSELRQLELPELMQLI